MMLPSMVPSALPPIWNWAQITLPSGEVREVDGVRKGFHVYFVRDERGIWRGDGWSDELAAAVRRGYEHLPRAQKRLPLV